MSRVCKNDDVCLQKIIPCAGEEWMCVCVHVYVLGSKNELIGLVFIEFRGQSLNPTSPQIITPHPINFMR